MERISNCCKSSLLMICDKGEAGDVGMCSECKEWCEIEIAELIAEKIISEKQVGDQEA